MQRNFIQYDTGQFAPRNAGAGAVPPKEKCPKCGKVMINGVCPGCGYPKSTKEEAIRKQQKEQIEKINSEIRHCSEQIERLKQEIREAAFDHPEKLYILRDSLDEVKRIKEEAEQKKQEIVKNQK